jgi:hypothetical protein
MMDTEHQKRGLLARLIKIAEKDEEKELAEIRTALDHAKDAQKLISPYKTDMFGVSYGIRWHSRQKKFLELIKESLRLTTDARKHLPQLEKISKEVEGQLVAQNKKLLPEEEQIIKEVLSAEKMLDSASKDLTTIHKMGWGSASSAFLLFGMYYVPVERDTDNKIGLNFRSEWVKPLHRTCETLVRFEKAVKDMYRLQKDIEKKYRK